MKRKLCLAGSICGTVASALCLLLLIIGCSVRLSVLAQYIEYAYVENSPVGFYSVLLVGQIIKLVIVGVASIVALILNAVAIGSWKYDKVKFKKAKGVNIAAIVFNILLAVYLIFDIIFEPFYGDTIMGLVFLFPLFILGAVFINIDIARENKVVQTAPISAPVQPAVKPTQAKPQTLEERLTQLQKFADMRDNKILTEEEYNQFKENLLKDLM